jgi:hypothetical protein
MNEDIYYYNDEPLQLSYSNNYTMADKIEIISNIQNDFKNGMLSWSQMRWIILNCRYGSYTCEKIVDKLIFSKKLKVNPITLDTRTFYKKPSAFDL